MDDGILSDNTVLGRVNLNDLELDLTHTTAHDEQVALAHWPVSLAEVWGEEDVEERASEALDRIRDRENSDALGL